MTGHIYRLPVVAALAIAMLPAAALAQTPAASIDPQSFRRALSQVDLSNVESPDPVVPRRGLSRGAKIGIGAGIGAAGGLLVGCPLFGQTLDIPHGVDMLMGAGIFAAAGAVIAAAIDRKSSAGRAAPAAPKKAITIAPVLSKSTKAVVVRLALK